MKNVTWKFVGACILDVFSVEYLQEPIAYMLRQDSAVNYVNENGERAGSWYTYVSLDVRHNKDDRSRIAILLERFNQKDAVSLVSVDKLESTRLDRERNKPEPYGKYTSLRAKMMAEGGP